MRSLQELLAVFDRSHAKFLGSAALVQLFPLLSAPIVARLYKPADFGVYAVFFALTSILAGVSALALNNVTLLEADDREAAHGALLGVSVVTIFCAVTALVVAVAPDTAKSALLGEPVAPHLGWLPLTVLLAGVFNCLYAWAIRSKLFDLLARNKLVLGASTACLQIGIGLADPGPLGFIVANLLGYLLALVLLAKPFWDELGRLKPAFGARSAAAQFKQHASLPLWTVPASLVNLLCSFLPELLINRQFGPHQLGQFSLANRVVNFPLAFVSTSAQDLFRQQASEEIFAAGHCRRSFDRFFTILTAIGLGLLIPVILAIPTAFPIIFGRQWTDAGGLIQAISVLLIVRFVSSPLSYVWILRGRQKLDFLWQIGLLAISLAAFLAPPLAFPAITLEQSLWTYSLAVAAWYAFCLMVSRAMAYEVHKGHTSAAQTSRLHVNSEPPLA